MVDTSLIPGVAAAGDVEVKTLVLIDTKNKNARQNLIGIFTDFTIYEDIFSPVLTGYVALIESQNLISSLPIVGGEQIYAEFVTPSLTPIKILFVVTKVGMRETGDKKNAYTLELISSEAFVDLNTRISKPFSGNPTTVIKTLYSDIYKKPILEADLSNNMIKFISPYWGPLKIMNHITARAIQPNNAMVTPNFLFYQTTGGHKFKSITTLFAQSPVMQYFFDKNPARETVSTKEKTSTRDINREYSSIKTLTFTASQDYVKNMLDGAYNHQVFTVNLFNKSFAIKNYSYTDSFAATTHTDKFKLNILKPSKSSGLNTIHPTDPNLFNGIPDISDEIIAKRISLLAQLETWKIGITVPGRTDMTVGMTVNINMNKFATVDVSDKNKNLKDPIYSGKYLITAIQHRFTMSKHLMNLECIKDSSFSLINVS